ncbi:hypothetical protein L2E82_33471 [Cichorium intybus]|uniref:Uncharacterized protein n=1 Tax=Cichorium intybus TaxID=13427 RepID=A0ACB9BK89_CICIN|nr:hypothetical protein L2E82_33471 [Cichorium intybus]
MASQAKLVLNCVGPFRLHGDPVVAACVEAGCDYLDICGEPEFMERMEAVYHEKAVEMGSLLISACGFDSIPAEFGFMFNSSQWVSPAVPNRVEDYINIESDKRIPGYAPPKVSTIEHQKKIGLWAVKLPSADATVVRRTLSILTENPTSLQGVNEDPKQAEKRVAFWSRVKPAHFGVKAATKSLLGLLPCLGTFRKKSTPTKDELESASFKMWFVGHGFSDVNLASQGSATPDTEIITRVMGPDVGYLTTSIILVQCALIILEQRGDLPKGGVFTPGIVFGHTDLQDRLQENGVSFDLISKSRFYT